ncbi:MAG: Fe-S cluster domain-containing protein, partial [Bacteroidetes bacterium]|nr:Fe-S cluster domain-containing protein [Bacteroidota bacterium]
MNTIVITILSLSLIGSLAAIILYFVAQKFKVIEDPRIDQVDEVLPGANCGGCGFPGCRGFAEACVNSEELADLFCPVGGNDCMSDVASVLGKDAVSKDPEVAVIRCSGSPEHRSQTNFYDGAVSCTVAHNLYAGDTGCQYGCFGCGDCVVVCDFDAIYMNEETKLPVVIDDACTACNACVEECPRDIIELRRKNKKDRKIFVSCVSMDKGGIAKKACSVACIGCKACLKVCPHDAITVENFLAYIDPVACKLCRKCVVVCPTDSILEINFPARKIKVEKENSAEEAVIK